MQIVQTVHGYVEVDKIVDGKVFTVDGEVHNEDEVYVFNIGDKNE